MFFVKNAYAQVNIAEPSVWPLARWTDLGQLFTSIIPNILIFAGVIFFILTVFAGISMLTSAGSGDAHASEKTKNFLTYSVVGLVIIFSAYWILQIVNYITKGSIGFL